MPDSETTQRLPMLSAAERARLFRDCAAELRGMARMALVTADKLERVGVELRHTGRISTETAVDLEAVAANLDELGASGAAR